MRVRLGSSGSISPLIESIVKVNSTEKVTVIDTVNKTDVKVKKTAAIQVTDIKNNSEVKWDEVTDKTVKMVNTIGGAAKLEVTECEEAGDM